MARRHRAEGHQEGRILVVDDQEAYLQVTKSVLEQEGFTVLTALDGPQALALLRETEVDLVLLDFFMPGQTGAEVVAELRTFRPHLQVVLQTGYASEKPARVLLRDLDIQGYFDKGEGVEKLLLWVEVGLKAARANQRLLYHRTGLRTIVEAAGRLHSLRPVGETSVEAAELAAGIARRKSDGHERPARCWIFLPDNDGEPVLSGGTGATVPPGLAPLVRQLLAGAPAQRTAEFDLVPLVSGEALVGVLAAEATRIDDDEADLLAVFAHQVAAALHNSQLYALATHDPLTGTFMRKFYDTWVQKELRTALRYRQPISLIMFDLDNMKTVNDTWGHPAGDAMLAKVGTILRAATRSSDFVARFGGDEFALLLPSTDPEGCAVVARKVLTLLGRETLTWAGTEIALSASLGGTTLLPPAADPPGVRYPAAHFEAAAARLLVRADHQLYAAKRGGKNGFRSDSGLGWE